MVTTEDVQAYVDAMPRKWKKFGRKGMQQIAEHFGGVLTSNGRYVKIEGQEYQIKMDYDVMRLKVRHMTWTHGTDFRYNRPY